MAFNAMIPSPAFANFAVQVGFSAARGSAIGAITSWAFGGDVGKGAKVGAIGGAVIGVLQSQQFGNWSAGNGFRSDRGVIAAKWEGYVQAQHALNANAADRVAATVISRPLGDPPGGSFIGARHLGVRGPGFGFDMGPNEGGMIFLGTGKTPTFDSYLRTENYIQNYPQLLKNTGVGISASGFSEVSNTYQSYWGNQPYIATSYNSNYASHTIVYGAGGNISQDSDLGWAPQFK